MTMPALTKEYATPEQIKLLKKFGLQGTLGKKQLTRDLWLTSEQARDLGIEQPAGKDFLISPFAPKEGELYGRMPVEEPPKELTLPDVFFKVYPDRKLGNTQEEIERNINAFVYGDTEGFVKDLQAKGRNPDTENLLRTLLSQSIYKDTGESYTPEEITGTIDRVFTPSPATEPYTIPPEGIPLMIEVPEQGVTVRKLATVKPDGKLYLGGQELGSVNLENGDFTPIKEAKPDDVILASRNLGNAWQNYVKGQFGWQKFPEVGGVLGAAVGVGGTWFQKYVGRPWESVVLSMRTDFQKAVGWETDIDKLTRMRIDEAVEKYGWAGALVSQDMADTWKAYTEQVDPNTAKLLTLTEWLNPVYIIPIGGTFGMGAKFTSKIPVIGKVAERIAAGVGWLERAPFKPLTMKIGGGLEKGIARYTAEGLSNVGGRLGEKAIQSIIGKSKQLVLKIPETDAIINGTIVENWQRKAIQTLAKLPGGRGAVEKGLGWRVLVDKEGQVVQDIVGRGAVAWNEITRMGLNARNIKLQELRSIEIDPVKLFNFGKNAYSPKMAARILPNYAGEANIGTLEHIFTHPQMYSLTEKQATYISRVNEINAWVLDMLKTEGVEPARMIDDWVHRVVIGKETPEGVVTPKGAPGRGGRGIGAKPAYEKPRTFKTMQEGMTAGILYEPNIEVSIGSYIEDAFRKVANERLEKYVAEFGITPSERLLQRFPEVAEAARLTQVELRDARYLQSAVNRAVRGEKLPEATLKAIERRFPEQGQRLRELIKGKAIPTTDADILAKAEADSLTSKVDEFGYPQPAEVITDEVIKPQVEGIKGLSGKTSTKKIKIEPPAVLSEAEKKTQLTALRDEAKELAEGRAAPYWKARAEKAAKMEIVRQPSIGEGYIMQPFAGGKIYEQEFIDSFNRFFGYEKGSNALKVTADTAGILRITKAALDFSAMMIQGLPSFGLSHAYLVADPKIGTKLMGSWYKALFESTATFFKRDIIAGYVTKNQASALERVGFGGSSRAIDYFTALQSKGGLGGVAEKALKGIPLKPFERAELSFFAAGEIVRDEFWKILAPKAINAGKGYELARSLDLMTGLAESKAIGVPLTIRQLESSFVWFAPNYTRACLTIIGDIFRGGHTGAMARKALGGMIAAGSAYYTGLQMAISMASGKSEEEALADVREGFGIQEDPITHEVIWHPTASFMTIKVGNYNFGVGGFWYGLVRLAGNIGTAVERIGESEHVDLMTILKGGGTSLRDNPFIYWWYSRSSPLVGTGIELATHKDFLGYPIETPAQYAQYIATRFEPIWMEQGINPYIPGLARDNEIPEGAARFATPVVELGGLRTFPESTWVKFYDVVNKKVSQLGGQELESFQLDEKQKEAWQNGKLTWKLLTDLQKTFLLSRYQDLRDAYASAQGDSAVRNSDEISAVFKTLDAEKQVYYERGSNDKPDSPGLVQQLLSGDIDMKTFREKWSDAGQNYGAGLDSLERNNPNFQKAFDYVDQVEKKRNEKYGFFDDLALAEYQQIKFEEILKPNGDIDWDAQDKKIDDFIEKWGRDTYDRILKMYSDKKALDGLNPILGKLSEDKEKLSRDYWRLPYKPIADMTEEDLANGDIPAEYQSLWKHYQTLQTDAERDKFKEDNPEFAKDWRGEYRLANPETDAILSLWGYGGKLQTMEAYNMVEKMASDLGIPFSSEILGLPPRDIITLYFDHNKIVKDTSGSSIQSKYYLLTDGKKYLDWMIEQGERKDDLSSESVDALRLRVANETLTKDYNSISDRTSPNFAEDIKDPITGLNPRLEAQKAWKLKNQKWVDDMRRVDMYGYSASYPEAADLVEPYVEYGRWIDKYGASSAEAMLYRHEHEGLEKFGTLHSPDGKLLTLWDKSVDVSRVPIWEIDRQYRVQDAEYQAILDKYDNSIDQAKATKAYLADENGQPTEYCLARRRRDALTIGLPDEVIDFYVGFYTKPEVQRPEDLEKNITWYGEEWYLLENPELYKAMTELYKNTDGRQGWKPDPKKFKNIPTREVFAKYVEYLQIKNNQAKRDQFRLDNPDLDEWGVSAGIWKETMSERRRKRSQTPAERFIEELQKSRKEFEESLK